MASFRVRTPAEYARMLWRRKFYVLVPTIIIAITLAYVVKQLADVYKSETLILVEQAKLDSKVGITPTQVDISSRLGTIRNMVTSRTELKGIIEQFDLYRDLRTLNIPEEEILNEMRKRIDVQVRNTGAGANAFTISFKGPDPQIVQLVTADLARRFIDANMDKMVIENRRLMDSLENRLVERKKQLEGIESERARMQAEHPEAFEGNDKTIIGQINSLQMQRQSMQSSIDSLQNNILMLEALKKNSASYDYGQSDPVKTFSEMQADSTLRGKKADLEAKLQTLLKIYKEKHPEVQEVRAQIEAIDKQIANARADAAKDREEANAKRAEEIKKLKAPELEGLNLRITGVTRELDIKQNDLNKLQAEINGLNSKLQTIPALQAAAQKIDRDYNTYKKDYDDLLVQKNNVEFGSKLQTELSGNTFRLQDPAYVPQKPDAPQRWMLYPLSLLVGLATGFVIAFAMEARSLFTIQDARDVEHYMHLPLLVTVPQIITDNERRQRAMLRLVQVAGVLLLIIVAIPVLVTILQRSRVLNIFAG